MGRGTANALWGTVRGTNRPAKPNKSSGIGCYAGSAPGDQAGRHRRTEGCDFAFDGLSGGVGGGCDYPSHAAVSLPTTGGWGRASDPTPRLPQIRAATPDLSRRPEHPRQHALLRVQAVL